MLNFLRKLRKSNPKNSQYLKYAFGEIFLVMIGILLAVQINNLNEERKNHNRLNDYKVILKKELQADLETLKLLKHVNDSLRSKMSDYLQEYNSTTPDVQKLKEMKIGEVLHVNTFNKKSFTLDELTDNGTIALFPDEVKQVILDLKYTQGLYGFYERESSLRIIRAIDSRHEKIDLLYEKGLTPQPHKTIGHWYQNLNDDQYRLLNNLVAKTLEYYDYQDNVVHPRIKGKTEQLMKLLEN